MATYVRRFKSKGMTYAYLRPSHEHAALGLRPCPLPVDGAEARAQEIIGHFQQSIDDGVLLRMSEHASVMLRAARTRASHRDIPFEIDADWIKARLIAIGYRCEVSGLPFDMTRLEHARNGPYRPSLDRLKPSLGYHPDNIRIVCVAVNAALGEWGDEVLFRIASAVVVSQSARGSGQPELEKLSNLGTVQDCIVTDQ